MKKIFHKNQIIITTLAFLIAIAGYISYDRAAATKDKKEDAPANATVENGVYEISLDDATQTAETMADATESTQTASTEVKVAQIDSTEEIKNPGEAVLTSTAASTTVDAAAQLKLNREQVRSKNKEALAAVISNDSLTEEQRKSAVDELAKITDVAEREADAVMTLEAKGFTDVVVSIDDENCDVILNMGEVTDARCAQVEDIVKRKTGVAADKIIITPITESGDTLKQ